MIRRHLGYTAFSTTLTDMILISGSVIYRPDPIEPPAEGNLLICVNRHGIRTPFRG